MVVLLFYVSDRVRAILGENVFYVKRIDLLDLSNTMVFLGTDSKVQGVITIALDGLASSEQGFDNKKYHFLQSVDKKVVFLNLRT